MRKLRSLTLALALAAAPAPLGAQGADLAQPCRDAALDARTRQICFAAAQAAESAQPQIGILVAGGNPTLGVAGPGGLRVGAVPVSVTARLNLALVRVPDILLENAGGDVRRVNDALGIPAPALGAAASVGLFPGVTVGPGLTGVGSLEVLGSAAWLPFRLLSVPGFEHGGSDLAYGAGARLGLLRETFTSPAISVSSMYRRLGTSRFGDVCRVDNRPVDGGCEGSAGEFGFDLTSWNHRLTLGKRLAGIGFVAGVGHDRHGSDADIAFFRPMLFGGEVQRASARLTSTRNSAFVNASYSFLLSTLSAEAGWMRGGTPIPEFRQANPEFDARQGTFFGSVGARLAF